MNIFGFDLVHALSQFDKLQELSPQEKETLLLMAKKFQDLDDSHFLSPIELTEKLGHSTKRWRQFLTLKPVKDYIARQVKEDAEISNRQAVLAQAYKAIKSGDSQAAKYLKELSDILNAENNQATIILHYIPRPNSTPTAPQPTDQSSSINEGG